ncbi:unnamed protein product [Adineta steineri]|uniref:RRM domain-containing protein n=1 Tax=Adineta steineri TaxID=433720 RepID=A0A819KF08_9BILA|nr:unnamed protein product [Adineta steineri]
MSSRSIYVPTIELNQYEMENFLKIVYKYEGVLNEYGAIKIQIKQNCKLALKKRQKKLLITEAKKQILKTNSSNLIYSIENIDDIDDESIEENFLIKDEVSFWSSLFSLSENNRQLYTSLLLNQSFFSQRSLPEYFDIHRISQQSILKIGGKNLTNQFTPCIKRAHRSGGIFPLKSSRQNLFSLDYHHEGGDHHWYVIPNSQRESLQLILNKYNLSNYCLEHGQIFLHPSLLDENNIRYHRIIQSQNQFVILSAGTLSQSFTINSSWTESIDFALPSWITKGYGTISNLSCQCNISNDLLPNSIDMNLFRDGLIKKYLTSFMNHFNYNKSIKFTDENHIDKPLIKTQNLIETNSLYNQYLKPTNMKLIIPRQKIPSCIHSPASINTYIPEMNQIKSVNNNDQTQYELLDQGIFQTTLNEMPSDLSLLDLISTDDLSNPDTRTTHSYTDNTTSTTVYEDFPNYCNINNEAMSFDELMDSLIPLSVESVAPRSNQIEEYINTSSPSTVASSISTSNFNKKLHNQNKIYLNKTNNDYKTLFVSKLKSNITKHDLYNHFHGCIKVTIKKSHSASDLKYAFVVHRTHERARRNFRQSINRSLLGSQCRVEFANHSLNHTNNHENMENKKKLVISRIPENVNENNLYNLFENCQILKYCPARVISSSTTTINTKEKKKILSGYAFILYDNEQQARDVLEHPDRYKIDGQSLHISLYRH